MHNTQATSNLFASSNPAARTNRLRWGGTCLSIFLVTITIIIGLGNRTLASVPIYVTVILIDIIMSGILIKGLLSTNRRFVFSWLAFVAIKLLLSSLIFFWTIFSRHIRLNLAFLVISNLLGVGFWLWTYSYYIAMPLVIDVMFVATQVHM